MMLRKEVEMHIEEAEVRSRMAIAEIKPILRELPAEAVQEVSEHIETALRVARQRLEEARNGNGRAK